MPECLAGLLYFVPARRGLVLRHLETETFSASSISGASHGITAKIWADMTCDLNATTKIQRVFFFVCVYACMATWQCCWKWHNVMPYWCLASKQEDWNYSWLAMRKFSTVCNLKNGRGETTEFTYASIKQNSRVAFPDCKFLTTRGGTAHNYLLIKNLYRDLMHQVHHWLNYLGTGTGVL